jgi:hypothetical protein
VLHVIRDADWADDAGQSGKSDRQMNSARKPTTTWGYADYTDLYFEDSPRYRLPLGARCTFTYLFVAIGEWYPPSGKSRSLYADRDITTWENEFRLYNVSCARI